MSFDAWIGREEHRADVLDAAHAARWLATFDRAPAQTLPQGIHLALCTPDAPTAALGPDGHPMREDSADSFLPPIPLPRRMWASSEMAFHAPISTGAKIERVSRVASITEKHGGSGRLTFVNIEHETSADGSLAVREMQTVVYREAAAGGTPLSPPPLGEDAFDAGAWEHTHSLTPDPRLLFRYSALTFNTHRIHYDAPYARDVELYRELVVHGPLTASLLLQLAGRALGENRLKTFAFRGVSPAVADEPLHLAMRATDEGYELGAFADDGRAVMKSKAT